MEFIAYEHAWIRTKAPSPFPPPGGGLRGVIGRAQSAASRMRLAWNLSTLSPPPEVMLLLSYGDEWHPEDGAQLKAHLRKFLKRAERRGWKWAWMVEFTERGLAHFHLFAPIPESLRAAIRWRVVERRGVQRQVCEDTGEGARLARDWEEISGAKDCRFHRGGILELLESKDAAARYAAKEAGKRAQKVAPPWFGHLGRWWGVPRGMRAEPTAVVTAPDWMAPTYRRGFSLDDVDGTIAAAAILSAAHGGIRVPVGWDGMVPTTGRDRVRRMVRGDRFHRARRGPPG